MGEKALKISLKKLSIYVSLTALVGAAVLCMASCSAQKACDEHKPGKWTVSKEPTCVEDGVSVRRCTVCDEIVEFRNDTSSGHEVDEWEVKIAPTCTEAGVEIQKCKHCQKEIAQRELAALGHAPGEFEISIQPTCTSAGQRIRKCSTCSEVLESDAVAMLSHKADTWTEIKEANCVDKGEKVRICEHCNQTLETQVIEPSGHVADGWEITKQATCTQSGSQQKKCVGCSIVMETQAIAAKGHTKGSWKIVEAATCTQSGLQQKKCTVCSEVVDTAEIAPKGHTEDKWIIDLEPTCTKEGERHIECKVCKETLKTEEIGALGHKAGEFEVVDEATCSKLGKKRAMCTVCQEEALVEDIPKISHEYEGDLCKDCGAERVSEGLEYEQKGDSYYVVGMGTCEDTKLIIPATYNDKAVIGIAENAFSGQTNIKQVIFKGSVTTISDGAFMGCLSLESVVLPDTLKVIGKNAFNGCAITSINIPSSLESIGDGAFIEIGIKELLLPSKISLGKSCFEKSSIESIKFLGEFTAQGSVFKNCKALESVVFEGNQIEIPSYFFQYCESLESVVFAGEIKEIHQYAFYGCTKLSFDEFVVSYPLGKYALGSVKIGELTVTYKTLSGLEDAKIENLILAEGVTEISEDALYRASVGTVSLPTTLEKVGTHAFYATTLEVVEFKSAVELGFGAFKSATELKKVVLPKGSTIEDYAFSDCQSLETVIFGGSREEWNKIIENYGYTAEDRKDFEGVTVECLDENTQDNTQDNTDDNNGTVDVDSINGAPIWHLKSNDDQTVADGVKYSQKVYVDDSDKQYKVSIITVDPSKAGFVMGTSEDGYDYAPDADKRQNTKQHIEAAVLNGASVLAGINADFFFINSDYHPEGLAVKNGVLISEGAAGRPYFAITKDNKAIIGASGTQADTDSIFTAVGGSHIILENGQIKDTDMEDSFGYTAHPRTLVGIKKDGTVILVVIDGRQKSVSNGASLEKCANLMIALGAYDAINLDGGGSSTMIVLDSGEYSVKNSPSDGKLRNIYNSLLVVER